MLTFGKNIACLVSIATLLLACNPTRRLAEGDVLLRKNKIESNVSTIDNYDLEEILKQRPNRKILGTIRFHLGVHNMANNGKDTRFRNWLMNTVGEAPVILDSALCAKSADQIQLFLKKKGYFNGKVSYTTKMRNDNQAIVTYYVEGRKPFKIKSISHQIEDSKIAAIYFEDNNKRKVAVGDIFDIEQLDLERQRIVTLLKNKGYYFFNKDYIAFQVDSSTGKQKIDLTLQIKLVTRKIDEFGDQTEQIPHQTYKIGKISINTNYYPRSTHTVASDTVFHGGFEVLYENKLGINLKLLANSLFIHEDQLYQLDKVEQSYRKLSDLGVYRSVNFKFEVDEDVPDKVNCQILLSPAKRQSYTANSGWTNTGGNQGVQLHLNYSNRNTFRGAETFQAGLYGGLEVQTTLLVDDEQNNIIDRIPFNTMEFGPEMSIFLPKFLLPIDQDKFSKSSNATTALTTSYNYQRRPDYTRTIAELSLRYRWKESLQKTHQLGLAEVSFIKIDKSAAFERRLAELNDKFLQTSYTDHLVPATQYTFTYNSQKASSQRNVMFYKGNISVAGNLLRVIGNMSGAQKDEFGSYEFLNIRFAQFVKFDNELRHYHRFDQYRSVAYRLMAGIGIPLTNLEVLPFEKSFFSGGANDIRSWKTRSLGPGSSVDYENRFDKIGDIRLQGSAEYRFGLSSLIEGAAFVDAGNIWLLNPDSLRPNGEFDPTRFSREIAVGAGLGIRLDFTFFIIRLDAGLQIKDPSLPVGERWIFQGKENHNLGAEEWHSVNGKTYDGYKPGLNFNLGIGYPF